MKILFIILSIRSQKYEKEKQQKLWEDMGRDSKSMKQVWPGADSDQAMMPVAFYLITANMFASVILEYIMEFAEDIYHDDILYEKARDLK